MEQFRRRYLRYLKLERNYTANTIEAYTHDLDYLQNFMRCENLTIHDVKLSHLETFAATIHEFGVSASSQARILSGVRSFFRFLVLDGELKDDPAELLESPAVGEHLPEVLSTEEVDRMERSIDLSKWEGQRNRAIIEVLFSCGLRVSELVSLRFSDISVKDKFLRIVGKGNKERLVPISDAALHEIQLWLLDRNLMKVKPGEDQYVFLNRRGAHLTRTMILIMIRMWLRMRASTRRCRRTRCATRLPRRCLRAAPTCEPSRRCWGTRTSRLRRYTLISTSLPCVRRFLTTTHAI